MQARSLGHPSPHLRVLVCGVVVTYRVNVEVLGCFRVDQPQEGEPLLMAVPFAAAREHLARGHVEAGEGLRRAVADVVVREGFGIADANARAVWVWSRA